MTTRTWDGGGGDELASNNDNWDGVPVAGDDLVLDGTSTKNMTWDISGTTFLTLSLNAGYTGTATQTATLNLTGKWQLNAGTWTTSNNAMNVGEMDMAIDALNGGSSTITASGNAFFNNWTGFDTSTVVLAATGAVRGVFYNLTQSDGITTTIQFPNVNINNALVTGDNTSTWLADNRRIDLLTGSNTFTFNGAVFSDASGFLEIRWSETTNISTIPTGDYNDALFRSLFVGTLTAGGNLTFKDFQLQSSGASSIVDMNGNDLTLSGTLTLGDPGNFRLEEFIAGIGTHSITGDLILADGVGAFFPTLTMNSSAFNVGGNITVTDSFGVIAEGTSTVTLNGTGAQAITLVSESLNNVTVTNTGGVVTFIDAADIKGAFTVDAVNGDVTVDFDETGSNTLGDWIVTGSGDSEAVIQSSVAANQADIALTQSRVMTHARFQDLNVTGGVTIKHYHSTDNGNNSSAFRKAFRVGGLPGKYRNNGRPNAFRVNGHVA